LAAARGYRDAGGDAELTLVGAEALAPYRRPPLTKEFLRGELDADELPIESPEWFAQNRVELRLGSEVRAIDPDAVTVELDGHTIAAVAIVLATGAEPTRPDIAGLDDPRVQTMRERSDSERIAVRAAGGTRIAVLGTGFIGCELAASLTANGAEVTLVGQEPAPQQERLGADAAARIAAWLRELGVTLRMGTGVAAVRDGRIVELEDGGAIDCDAIVLGMGMRPRSELAERAGLATEDGAVLTDGRMRAHERVLAAGDVAYAFNGAAGRRLRVEHWGDALEQGEVAGRVLAGEDAQWRQVPGFWSGIGPHTLKYVAWGDGHDTSRLDEYRDGAFTVWYSREGVLVGALTHDRDEDYERAREMIASGAPPP
jgi:3-phenylpropionate/trans-cinnamate dioxygenase ferredoxin reductase component